MHNYFTNYHTPTCFETTVSSSRELVINTLPSYTSTANAAVGNTIYNLDVSHRFYASSHIIVVEISL